MFMHCQESVRAFFPIDVHMYTTCTCIGTSDRLVMRRLEDCGNHTELEKEIINLSNFWLEGVVMVSLILLLKKKLPSGQPVGRAAGLVCPLSV